MRVHDTTDESVTHLISKEQETHSTRRNSDIRESDDNQRTENMIASPQHGIWHWHWQWKWHHGRCSLAAGPVAVAFLPCRVRAWVVCSECLLYYTVRKLVLSVGRSGGCSHWQHGRCRARRPAALPSVAL